MSSIVNDVVNYNDLAVDSRPNNSSISSLCRIDPVTKTASFVVSSDLYDTIIVNGSAGVTVTLPSASLNSGRVLHFKNLAAQTLSASASVVVPFVGGAAGTAIIPATANRSVTLLSDGTSWISIRGNTPA